MSDRPFIEELPIDSALPELIDAVRRTGRAVLQAPPGAGKTTRVPLALLEAGLVRDKIVMLEPRRLAARAAAERMAKTLGEKPGQTVGYRMRGDTRTGPATRIEVVTEGILTRMIQADPGLSGIGAVIFDEFHERSLNADLGLALCLEIAEALRDDLALVAMSATLDAEPVADLMAAPLVTSEGRSFPVDIRWSEAPLGKRRLEDAVAAAVETALRETEGGVLVFLPGEPEIRRAQAQLAPAIPSDAVLAPLYGALPFDRQRAAIQPAPKGRKVVLATAIAETSLTIEGIRAVVDAGFARRARFDPGSGMSRLVTERVTRAEAAQRTGRAGRVAPGVSYRLWTRGEEGALAAFPPAEIESADLAGLALELAQWGTTPEALPFLTQPPAGAYAEAQALLVSLGALDPAGRITAHGRALAAEPLHPRIAHMLVTAGRQAAMLAALIEDRDPLRGASSDLALRLEALADPETYARRRPWPIDRAAIERIRAEARRLSRGRSSGPELSPAAQAALAYPDRVSQRRPGKAPRYLMSGGKGARLAEDDPLAGAPWLIALDTDGNPREARIRLAAPITETELRALFANEIITEDTCVWSRREGRVLARRLEKLGALTLSDRVWRDVPAEAVARAMLDGVRDLGLHLSPAARRLAARVQLMRATAPDFPDMSEPALMARLEDWLLPHLGQVRSAEDWRNFDVHAALHAMLDWDQHRRLDEAAPASFTTPLGRRIPIDYSSDPPEITLRIQEMFGQREHPKIGDTPLRITLLSPGQKPLQTTTDLPGFWTGSYADVRKEMRGRYPKHPWPEDPREANPTLRAKPRR